MHHSELLLVLDFGSQYTQLIARRVREIGVYSEIHPFNLPIEKIRSLQPVGIILSGGPSSVYEDGAPKPSRDIFELGVPVLGICYGLQIIADQLGGKVDPFARREFGKAILYVDKGDDLLEGLDGSTQVWMSHGDSLSRLPEGFEPIAHSDNAPICAVRNPSKRIFGVQFHPEVVHTPGGKKVLSNFLFRICKARGDWTPAHFIQESTQDIRAKVGSKRVLCALSGGVDSSVAAVLLHEAVGDQLHCIHINNGLMRKGESEQVVETFRKTYHTKLTYVDATDIFLERLSGVAEPEKKRRIIGNTFIEVFETEAKKIAGSGGDFEFLAQGTLYPDVIESTSFKGPSVTIKTHHNVGGLRPDLPFALVEPLRELFKDEVRQVGRELGLPEEIVRRHPFPGPGLAVRILGPVDAARVATLQLADAIYLEEIRAAGLYDEIWQAFAVLLPVRSVGVQGDFRTYAGVIALRAVTSLDGMTADWYQFPHDVLGRIATRIINEVKGVNRVVYDVSSKPPATIEWE